jgi:tetratricopeptide (TPR) repeat protein
MRKGQVNLWGGNAKSARFLFEKARAEALALLTQDPDQRDVLLDLCRIDAYLGRADEAVKEANRGVELASKQPDSFVLYKQLETLACVYSLVGRVEDAVQVFNRLLAAPSGIIIGLGSLKFDPDYDNLRGNPRFKELVARAEQQQK